MAEDKPVTFSYRCNRCGKVVQREVDRRWFESWCEETGQMTRLWRVIEPRKTDG